MTVKRYFSRKRIRGSGTAGRRIYQRVAPQFGNDSIGGYGAVTPSRRSGHRSKKAGNATG